MSYELQVTNEPDQDGWYFASVYQGGRWVQSFVNQDRAKVEADARAYVEWAKTADRSVETIVL